MTLLACTSPSDTSTTLTAPVPDGGPLSPASTEQVPSSEVGVEGETIRVGVIVPRSGPLAPQGEAVLSGQTAYWSYVNTELGGVGGRFEVAIVTSDSSYDPDTAMVEFRDLSSRVIAISGSLGTVIDERLAPLVLDEGMLMMAGSLSSEWVGHDALIPNLLLPTYRDQTAGGLFWASSGDVSSAAVLFQEGSYGEDCLLGYDRAVDELGLSNVGRLGHSSAATDFGDVVEQLKSSGAEVVVLCSTPDALVRIIATSSSLDFLPTWLVTSQSFDQNLPAALGGDEGVEAGLIALERTWVLGAGMPETSPAGQLLRDVVAGDSPTSWYTLFGYSQAATLHLILEEAVEASDLTRDGLKAALSRLDGVDLGLDGPLSTLTGPVPVDSAVGSIGEESLLYQFGVSATEPYVRSIFNDG